MKLLLILALIVGLFASSTAGASANSTPWWKFQAIDTMKYSRDPSREFLSDPQRLTAVADAQTAQIAAAGATHIGIATPYDDEFLPVLKTWVNSARNHNLKIWFRGNWSGWEGWFGYDRITRADHLAKTKAFLEQHPDLFEDGDVFSACPECENGGPGDPRMNGDAAGHRQFLIDEYTMMRGIFKQQGKNVRVNFNSMNGDVARLIMDKPTTQALGGLVVVDHYVRTPERLNQDVTDFAQRSGGKVILGEWGAPIPDINGSMTPEQQAEWIRQSLSLLAKNESLVGLSYWTNIGGSTAIWEDNGAPRPAVSVLSEFYKPKTVSGKIQNPLGEPINLAVFKVGSQSTVSMDGEYDLAYIDPELPIQITASNYQSRTMTIAQLVAEPDIILTPQTTSWWYNFRAWMLSFFR